MFFFYTCVLHLIHLNIYQLVLIGVKENWQDNEKLVYPKIHEKTLKKCKITYDSSSSDK